jgi:hypothetical protein
MINAIGSSLEYRLLAVLRQTSRRIQAAMILDHAQLYQSFHIS